MVDNPAFLNTLQVPVPDYLRYEGEPDEHFNLGYHRSSSSSSSADSGKQLVHSENAHSLYGRFDRKNHHREQRNYNVKSYTRDESSSSGSSPEVHKNPKKFYIGAPSTPESSRGSSTTSHSSPEPPYTPSTAKKFQNIQQALYPKFLYDPKIGMPSPRMGKIRYIYENYSPMPRAKYCNPKECYFGTKCSKCAMKEETISTCSSEEPPPTFTAFDNYQPRRKKSKYCSCGTLFLTTSIISILVLLLITAFIVYIEMVIKRNQYTPEPM